MDSRIGDLRCKEIIDVGSGCRYGYVGDVEVDLDSGRLRALVVPGRLRLLGLLGRTPDQIFPWERVRRFGEDIILVEQEPQSRGAAPGGGHPAPGQRSDVGFSCGARADDVIMKN